MNLMIETVIADKHEMSVESCAPPGAFGRWNQPMACLALLFLLLAFSTVHAQQPIQIVVEAPHFGEKPIPVALEGFTGEAESVLKFDLTVQGFSFTDAGGAQYVIKGSSAGSVTGSLTDNTSHKTLFSHVYNGAGERRQAHAFADDIVHEIRNIKPIGGTKIAYKSQSPQGPGEIYVADFDGYGPKAVTSDGAIVAKPAWMPGRMALFYTTYARSNPDIFYHNLSSGQRQVFAGFSGLNTSATVSPDGTKVAMVLSKAGSPNVWICNADGRDLRRVTTGVEDSSPCWSPDGRWICFAAKDKGRRELDKVSVEGGTPERVPTTGVASPTEPDWSPDSKWIAFTRQAGGEFDICVTSADGTIPPVVLVPGQDPSWSPNSRTLIYNQGPDGQQSLAVLDVFTKQHMACRRASGSNSEPAWAR